MATKDIAPIDIAEVKPISPLISQTSLRICGSFCSTHVGNDVYYLIRAVDMLRADLGEEYVKQEWEKLGRNWERTKKNIVKLNKLATKVKAYYDKIEDKRGDRKMKEIDTKKYYLKTASKLPALQPELYDLFVFLAKKSPIHRQTIPSDAFKILEHAGRKPLEMGKARPAKQQATTEVSQSSD